ncbi:MAG: hypothetical protein RLZZ126_1965 [Pseudomonadota bacterium]
MPALSGRVVDLSATLAAPEREALEAKLAAFERDKGSQIVVLLVQTTQPEDIASYAYRVASSWKIGRRDVGDGVLLIVARQDRRVRIEVAKALEGAIPDLAAKRVIDEAITPEFRQGHYARGVDAGVDRLIGLVSGEALPAPASRQARGQAGMQWADLAIFLFFAVPVVGKVFSGMLGRKGGALATGLGVGGLAWWVTVSLGLALAAGVLALLVALVLGGPAQRFGRQASRGGWNAGGWSSGAGSGGSWSGGSGGGFSSGGGGDFGGGGASGDW